MGTSTLPHERENSMLADIIDDCVKGRNKLVLVVCDSTHLSNYIIVSAKRIAEDSSDNFRIDISRDYLMFDNGARVIFTDYGYAGRDMRGITPDRIVLMGRWSEFWFLAISSGAKIDAVG